MLADAWPDMQCCKLMLRHSKRKTDIHNLQSNDAIPNGKPIFTTYSPMKQWHRDCLWVSCSCPIKHVGYPHPTPHQNP
jgi:hypothetical protein